MNKTGKRQCCDSERGHGPHAPGCYQAENDTKSRQGTKDRPREVTKAESEPDWSRKCIVCGDVPIMPLTGMCGPCTFGEAATHGGNW